MDVTDVLRDRVGRAPPGSSGWRSCRRSCMPSSWRPFCSRPAAGSRPTAVAEDRHDDSTERRQRWTEQRRDDLDRRASGADGDPTESAEATRSRQAARREDARDDGAVAERRRSRRRRRPSREAGARRSARTDADTRVRKPAREPRSPRPAPAVRASGFRPAAAWMGRHSMSPATSAVPTTSRSWSRRFGRTGPLEPRWPEGRRQIHDQARRHDRESRAREVERLHGARHQCPSRGRQARASSCRCLARFPNPSLTVHLNFSTLR